MTTPRARPNIYSLKSEIGHDLRAVKINSSHIIHAGQSQHTSDATVADLCCTGSSADGSPRWIQKVISKVVTQEEARWAERSKYRTRVLTYVWLRPL